MVKSISHWLVAGVCCGPWIWTLQDMHPKHRRLGGPTLSYNQQYLQPPSRPRFGGAWECAVLEIPQGHHIRYVSQIRPIRLAPANALVAWHDVSLTSFALHCISAGRAPAADRVSRHFEG